MKKVLSLIIAVLICISSVMIVSAETEVPKITDLVSPEQVSGLENIDVISKDSSEQIIAILAYNSNYDIALYTSSNGKTFSNINLTNCMSEFLPESNTLWDYGIRKIQFVNDILFVFGYYIVEENFNYKEYIVKYDSERGLYDFTTFEFGINEENYNRSPQIEECNGKYVYYFEDCAALCKATGEMMGYSPQYSIYSAYYISDDLKTWEQMETPSFYGRSIYAGYSRFKMSVSGTGITVIGYVHYYSGDSETPNIEIFASTTDFKNYKNLDLSVFDEISDAPYTFSYNLSALHNGKVVLFFQRAYQIKDEDCYPYYYYKYFDCYLIDMSKGSIEKIISDSNDDGIGWLFINMNPEITIVTFSDEFANLFNYSCETNSVSKSTLNSEQFFDTKVDFSSGEPDFWDCSENETLFFAYTEKETSIVSAVNYNYSKVHLFSVTQTESLFIWNEKGIAYFYSDDDCIAVSLTELMDKLNGDDSSNPDDTPAFEAICPDCGDKFTDEAEYDRHMNSHDNDDYEQPVLDKVFKVNKPTTSTVNYGDTLILHANISEVPEGCSVVWSVEGTGVELSPSADGTTCAVTCTGSGGVAVKATVVDENGNVITDSEGNECSSIQILTAKASFFQKLISFFKNLFGMVRIIPQLLKTAF